MTITTAAAGRIALLTVSLACSNLLLAARAEGAPVAIDEREVEARRDFAEGRYPRAIHLFAELYAHSADPIHLRNIARCYQKMRRPDEAIANFRDYLAKATVDAEERREIQAYIAEMEALRGRDAAARASAPQGPTENTPGAPSGSTGNSATPAPASTTPPGSTVTTAPAVAPAASEASATAAVAPESRAPVHGGGRSGFQTAGIAVGATGAALVVGGALFGWATLNASNKNSDGFDPNRDRWGPRFESLQFIGYATGAIGLIAGASLYWYGSESREHAPTSAGRVTAAVAPWPARLVVEGRF